MTSIDLQEYLVGAWQLRGWRIEYDSGEVTYPFGENALGQIMYTANGGMSATISAANRQILSEANVREAPPAEQAEAFSSYFHYAGRWHIDGQSVVHSVTLSLNPAMVGNELVRLVEVINDQQMILSASEPIADGQRQHIIEWQRLAPPS